MDHLDYNGLLPYLKMLAQLQQGKSFLESGMDARGEESGSTCVGMSHAILEQLKEKHGVEGCLAVQRRIGEPAFEHAAVIVECNDGYVLLDTRSNPNHRIFSVPFNQRTTLPFVSLVGSQPGSYTPITMTLANLEAFEYCTNIANSDELVTKHFMMEAPFIGDNPAFPISAYYPNGRASKAIFVSLLQAKLTLKNGTIQSILPVENPDRTVDISFDEIERGLLYNRLERLYNTGLPSFHIPLDELHLQLMTLVANAEAIRHIFRNVHFR